MNEFLQSLLSRKLISSAGAIALINSLPLSTKWKGVLIAVITIGYGVLNVWEKIVSPPSGSDPAPPAVPDSWTPAEELPPSPPEAPVTP